MLNEFSRTELLLGNEAMQILAQSRVAIFGVGGVGSFTTEALARSGVGSFVLVDDDKVCLTNVNRQLIATHSSIGKFKVDVMKERILDINPRANVEVHKTFFLPDTKALFDFSSYSYAIDAVDTVTAKVLIVEEAKAADIPVICAMGAGNKLDPTQFEVADLSQTSICPLARALRKALKKRGIQHVKVVYSKEKPVPLTQDMSLSCKTHCICPPGAKHKCTERRSIPGSTAFVPSVAGLIIAGEVVKDLTKAARTKREA